MRVFYFTFADGLSDKRVVIYGTVWMCISQQPAFYIYAAFLLIGKFIFIVWALGMVLAARAFARTRTHCPRPRTYMYSARDYYYLWVMCVCVLLSADVCELLCVAFVVWILLPSAAMPPNQFDQCISFLFLAIFSKYVFSMIFGRYYAIVKPLKYPMTITKKVVAIMILNTWISPALLSFIPIFAGWYTTQEHKDYIKAHPEKCEFEVNRVYAVISSSISFWIPCTIMIFTYLAIFREANRQEKQLAMRQGNAMLMHRHSSAGGTNGLCNLWHFFFFCMYVPLAHLLSRCFSFSFSLTNLLKCTYFIWTHEYFCRRSIERIWLIENVNTKRGRPGSQHTNKR